MVKIYRKVNDLGPSVSREATAHVPYHDWDIMSGSGSEYFFYLFCWQGSWT